MNTGLVLKLWVLKHTRQSDLLGYGLDRSGFPNVNLGKSKWLDFWEREFKEKYIRKLRYADRLWGGTTAVRLQNNLSSYSGAFNIPGRAIVRGVTFRRLHTANLSQYKG